MKTIWKFTLEITYEQTVEMPTGAALLCVQIQGGKPQLWALVDPSAPRESRTIITLDTDEPAPDRFGAYLGTYQTHRGAVVSHVFEGVA